MSEYRVLSDVRATYGENIALVRMPGGKSVLLVDRELFDRAVKAAMVNPELKEPAA